jgi:hypothetical protein
MDGWEVIENESDEFCAVKQIGVVCISVDRDAEGYVPKLSMDDYGDVVSKGTPMRTIDLAMDAAHALVPLHMRAVARSFRPFGEGADCIVNGHADSDGRFVRVVAKPEVDNV